jgi:hypothetical protein
MSVTNLRLERFGPFGRAELPLTSGVNVLLGANSTGKTFALKALYSILKGLGPEAQPGTPPREQLREKLAGCSGRMRAMFGDWWGAHRDDQSGVWVSTSMTAIRCG